MIVYYNIIIDVTVIITERNIYWRSFQILSTVQVAGLTIWRDSAEDYYGQRRQDESYWTLPRITVNMDEMGHCQVLKLIYFEHSKEIHFIT